MYQYDQILASVKFVGCHPDILVSDCDYLWTVTTIACSERFGGMRTPVICSSLVRAKEIVENNECDMWETTYHLVVIEGTVPDFVYGLSGKRNPQYWYIWKDGKYLPIETPEDFKNVCSFGVG